MKDEGRVFIVYGYDDPDEAPILVSTHTSNLAKQITRDSGGVCYSYNQVDGDLTDETREDF